MTVLDRVLSALRFRLPEVSPKLLSCVIGVSIPIYFCFKVFFMLYSIGNSPKFLKMLAVTVGVGENCLKDI
jgi:hypothetical protein